MRSGPKLGSSAGAARVSRALRALSWLLAVTVLFVSSGACSYAPDELEITDADARVFAEEVYPILLTDCGYPACHGTPERFFALYGPGRTRLDPMTDAYAPATAQELALSYTRARSMLISPEGPRRAPLLRKPLAVSAGGAAHEGDDPWGNAIYATKRDPHYEALFFWATASARGELRSDTP